ncbi:hypothetical protein AX774_g6147 [Zancudomyces culisetae]|uniref:Uncharacterized protein n=1 Tax=Zancudomyces culisetae TaxID=1213189 RepID=A0A1R1PHG4_ZANCU|nr:hypothetical protein AX774_g6147 [Zancudomyces culisetae]|eukprot:OMH80416.1 hypothetical protein AX774_g6147 [Zancudomyces culisetae]
MSGFMSKFKPRWIQTEKDEGRYSSDSDRSGATSMEVDPKESRDPYAVIMDHVFLQLKNPTKDEAAPNLTRHHRIILRQFCRVVNMLKLFLVTFATKYYTGRVNFNIM